MLSQSRPISGYPYYCTGYNGQNGYFTALTPGIGTFKKTFSHAGSDILDHIVAYDRAEIDGPYIGQINMTTVSSFCGPEGLIWGYDVARVDHPRAIFVNEAEFSGINILDGGVLKEAAVALFGTNQNRRFPFLPGSHVPCAGKFRYFDGPTTIYYLVAIGIASDRERDACLFMEDVGEVMYSNGSGELGKMKELLAKNAVHSVLAIGTNQKIKFKEIFVDIGARNVPAGEVGCALAAMPYFHIAKNAYDKNLHKMTLGSWAVARKTINQ